MPAPDPAPADADAHAAAAQAYGDLLFLSGTRSVLRAASKALPDSVYGTSPNLFGDFSVDADTYDELDARIPPAMSAAWVAFAKTGSPNGPGLASWPAFTAGHEGYMEFGDRIVAKEALRKKQLDFMSEFVEGLRRRPAVTTAGR